jgi:hypothetical protein
MCKFKFLKSEMENSLGFVEDIENEYTSKIIAVVAQG